MPGSLPDPPSIHQLGKLWWPALHAFAWSYPVAPSQREQQRAVEFFRSLGVFLRCSECRSHWEVVMTMMPPAVESREALFAWLVDRHNDINRIHGQRPYSEEEAVADLQSRVMPPPPPPPAAKSEGNMASHLTLLRYSGFAMIGFGVGVWCGSKWWNT
jgi:hypothetical protein